MGRFLSAPVNPLIDNRPEIVENLPVTVFIGFL
jgi:hypothetical protein